MDDTNTVVQTADSSRVIDTATVVPADNNLAADFTDAVVPITTDSSPADDTDTVGPITVDSPAMDETYPVDSSAANDYAINDPECEDLDDDDPAYFDPTIFPLSRLPQEVQDLILIEIAVDRRLATDSFEKVYSFLAPVCKRWQAVLKNLKFFKEVKERAFKRDGRTRYRRQSQQVRVEGIGPHEAEIECAVILGTNLYLIEVNKGNSSIGPSHIIYVYDLDLSDYDHIEPCQRKIICSDRRELTINEPDTRLTLLMASPAKNCLYFLAWGSHVYRVSPDGVVNRCGKVCGNAKDMSVDNSGEHLVVTTADQIFVYSTSTMQITSRLKLDVGERFRGPALCFLSAALRDDLSLIACLRETLNTLFVNMYAPTANGKSYEKSVERFFFDEYELSIAPDDKLCTVLMGTHLHPMGPGMERGRKMSAYFESGMGSFTSRYSYDRRRGLVIGIYRGRVTMMRVTL